ncbi:MAG TPA: hypothetical protein VGE79_03380, partial [Niastella sp.]
PLDKDFKHTLLLELIKDGGFIFLLDGYDEIALSEREKVTADIQGFISKAPKNKFVLTSRPENALASFGDFHEFKIEPLTRREAFELLRKYDKRGSVSSLLIKKLEDSDMRDMSEFLTNPLLVSLLFTAFQHKQTIPFKKYIFYRQVYDANFENHDLTKGDSFIHSKYSGLEIDDFHRVLRHIGFSCLKDNQRIEFTKDEILSLIRKAKFFCVDLDFNESDFLKDLLVAVPLFARDGIYYRWAHKSLQEYFAAQFIYLDSKEQQSKILLQLYNSPSLDKFINLIDLYYDIDPKTFRSTILYEYLCLFKCYFNSCFQDERFNVEEEAIVYRKDLSFLHRFFLIARPDVQYLIHDVVDNIAAQYGNRIYISLFNLNSDETLAAVILFDVKDELTSMIYHKIPDLFRKHLIGENPKDEIAFLLRNQVKPYLLNDSIGDKFNSSEIFDKVNMLLQSLKLKIERPIINSKVAFQLLAEIENQIQLENREDFLLDGI